MLPPLNDLIALLCIDLVLSAGLLRLLSCWHGVTQWAKWAAALVFVLLWCPVGSVHLPLVAYVRGISSDLSVSLVVMACIGMYQRLSRGPHVLVSNRERNATSLMVAAGALLLYPFALGVGDWDSYRLGWGTPGMWAALLAISIVCWGMGLRLLPMLIAVGMLAWTAGLLESTNLWDYLIDPWLAVGAIFQCLKVTGRQLLARVRMTRPGTGRPLSG